MRRTHSDHPLRPPTPTTLSCHTATTNRPTIPRPGDEILLSASYDDTIRCWAEDAGDWYCAATLAGVHTSTVWTIALAPGGVRMVSGSADESIAVWRCRTGSEKDGTGDSGGARDGDWHCVKQLPSSHTPAVHSVHCAPSVAGHGRIASCGADNVLRILREEVPSPHPTAVGGDGHDGGPTFVVDAQVLGAHDGDVNCVRWHPRDGTRLASVGDDGAVKVWRYRT